MVTSEVPMSYYYVTFMRRAINVSKEGLDYATCLHSANHGGKNLKTLGESQCRTVLYIILPKLEFSIGQQYANMKMLQSLHVF